MNPATTRPTAFDDIQFDPDDHRYSYGGAELASVTSVASRVKPPFDAEEAAHRVAAREGCTPHDVLREWEAKRLNALQLGTAIHEIIAEVLSGGDFEVSPDWRPELAAFHEWWNRERDHLDVLEVEWAIGSARLGIAGTLDLLAYDKRTGALHVYDFKTGREFTTGNRWGRTLLPPFAHLDDCHLHRYSLQVSLYNLILTLEAAHVLADPLGGGRIVYLGQGGVAAQHDAQDLVPTCFRWLRSETA